MDIKDNLYPKEFIVYTASLVGVTDIEESLKESDSMPFLSLFLLYNLAR